MQESDDNRDIGPDGDGAVALDDIEFRYAQRQAARVLRGISMKVSSGSLLARTLLTAPDSTGSICCFRWTKWLRKIDAHSSA